MVSGTRWLFLLLLALSAGVVAAAETNTCVQRDFPRRSFQWPKPKSGMVQRSSNPKPIFVDDTLTLKDAANSLVVKKAFDDMVAELKKIQKDGCKADATRGILKTVTVVIADKTAALLQGVDESYTLELKGTAVGIKAVTEYGARHGIVTLHNMLEIESCVEGPDVKGKFDNIDTAGGRYMLPFDNFKVEDAPRMVHRGFMLDTARTFIPKLQILETLRVMGRSKMNVFHWHATDDQSFPLVMPKTAKTIHGDGGETCMTNTKKPCLGAYSNEKTYSKDDIKKIIDEARLYGVRVLIEIDMPSHARSWGSADKSYLECYDENHQTGAYCAEQICGPLSIDTNYDKAMELAKLIFDDVDSFVSKGEIIHIGMDEVKTGCWGQEKTEQHMMKWLEDMVTYAATKERRLAVWQDVMFDHKFAKLPEIALKNKVIGQVWSEPARGVKLIKENVDIIWSDYTKMYLDCGRGNPVTPQDNSWCDPYKTWWDVFSVTPETLTNVTEEQERILGGEVAMWGEQVNEFNLHSLLWPRVSAWGGASWEPRPGKVNHYPPESVTVPQYNLKQFSWAMLRECIPFSPMQIMWCNYGDAIPDSKGELTTRQYCDIYSSVYYKDPNVHESTTENPDTTENPKSTASNDELTVTTSEETGSTTLCDCTTDDTGDARRQGASALALVAAAMCTMR